MAAITQQYSGYASHPSQPPSPPADNMRLPSIHSMFKFAGAGSPTSETAPQRSPVESHFQNHDSSSSQKSQSRPSSSYSRTDIPPRYALTQGMPPTPPMGSDVSFDNRAHSPSSSASIPRAPASKATYYQEPTPERDDHLRRPVHHAPAPQQHYAAPAPAPVYHQGPPPPPPAPQQMHYAMQYQRPLPQNFVPPQHYAPHPAQGQWQPQATAHHHYLNPSQGPTYAQTQDRYICPQCGKAFSRPSSLRIHTHSHTGEKPFKCPKPHCNKAFSVRSNMKRHEKGCTHHDLILKGR